MVLAPESFHGGFHLPGTLAGRPGKPVQGSEMVQDLAPNTQCGVGAELRFKARIEAVDRVDQAQQAATDQIAVFLPDFARDPHSAEDIVDKGYIPQYQIFPRLG